MSSAQQHARQLLGSGLLQAEDLRRPIQIERYRVVRLLGEGATATVSLAQDERLDREVALKLLKRPLGVLASRFQREIEVLVALDHPNIVAIFDAGVEDGLPYFVMEYVAGGSLADHSELDLRRKLAVIRDACFAVHAAHKRGIVHRDIKPSNLLVASDGARVADFGVAKVLDGLDSLTRTGQAIGTAAYMAPEQLGLIQSDVGPATDVYALGVCLYEALTRQLPHAADTPLEQAARMSAPPPSPQSINSTLPAALGAIAMQALQLEPAQRFSTAQEMGSAIQRYLSVNSRGHPPESPPAPAGRLRRPSWGLIGTRGWVVLALVVLLGVALLWTTRGDEQVDAVVSASPSASPPTFAKAGGSATDRGELGGATPPRHHTLTEVLWACWFGRRDDLTARIVDLDRKHPELTGAIDQPLRTLETLEDLQHLALLRGLLSLRAGDAKRAEAALRSATGPDADAARMLLHRLAVSEARDFAARANAAREAARVGALAVHAAPTGRIPCLAYARSLRSAALDLVTWARVALGRPGRPGVLDATIEILRASVLKLPEASWIHTALGSALYFRFLRRGGAPSDRTGALEALTHATRLDSRAPEPWMCLATMRLLEAAQGGSIPPQTIQDSVREAVSRQPAGVGELRQLLRVSPKK